MEGKTLYQTINPKKITLFFCAALASRATETKIGKLFRARVIARTTPAIWQHSDVGLVDGRIMPVVAETVVCTGLSKDCMHQRSGGKGIPIMAERD